MFKGVHPAKLWFASAADLFQVVSVHLLIRRDMNFDLCALLGLNLIRMTLFGLLKRYFKEKKCYKLLFR